MNVLIVNLVIILVFAILYFIIGPKSFSFPHDSVPSLFDSFYYSVVVHTTLGFGDILPANKVAKFVTMIHLLLVLVLNTTNILSDSD